MRRIMRVALSVVLTLTVFACLVLTATADGIGPN
jgi:hypothetical protein